MPTCLLWVVAAAPVTVPLCLSPGRYSRHGEIGVRHERLTSLPPVLRAARLENEATPEKCSN